MAFPKSTRTKAWDAILTLFKSDPVLKREVKTFRTWKGEGRDKPDLTTKSAPYLLLEIHPDKTKWIDTATVQSDYVVDVEMGIAGTEPDVLVDFWSAIEAVIYPDSNSQRDAAWSVLNRHGVVDVQFEQGDWGDIDKDADGGAFLVGHGKIRLSIQLQMKDY